MSCLARWHQGLLVDLNPIPDGARCVLVLGHEGDHQFKRESGEVYSAMPDQEGLRPVDKNHLPPELAAQILEREALLKSEPLRDDVRELLTILAEECGEVVQRVTKILRFGLTVNPWNGKDNRDELEIELGDLEAIQRVLGALSVIDRCSVDEHATCKVAALRKNDGRLRHAKVPAKGFL